MIDRAASPREISAVLGENKLAIVFIVNRFFLYRRKLYIIGDAIFLYDKQQVIGL